jgi:archaellum component FlaF (FlaF/FlaG flagellin family)
MKLNTGQKAAIGIGFVTFILAYGKKKYDDYTEVINALTFRISDVSNVKIQGLSLFFDIAVKFHNPTNKNFYINGLGLISVKKVKVFRKGVFIGEANSDVTKFEIPAFGFTTLSGITIETKYLTFLSELSNLASLTEVKDYTLEIIVEALGQTYIIEQPLSE